MPYVVSDTPPSHLTTEQLKDEREQIRVHLTEARAQLAAQKEWKKVPNARQQELSWRAKTLTFVGHLESRLALVKAELVKRQRVG